MEFISNVTMVMVIIFLVMVIIFLIEAIYPKDSDINIAKYEAAIKSWALTAATNLAIGMILLLIEKYILN